MPRKKSNIIDVWKGKDTAQEDDNTAPAPIIGKSHGNRELLSRLYRLPTIGPSMLKPRVSDNSRIHYRRPVSGYDDMKCRRRGRNDGKLAQLLDMPLDVVFEITSMLKPLDLLQLSRVSKQFRQTFASKSSRMLWAAARKNASGMPDPPEYLSEPRYAALLFEYACFACGVGRSPKVDFALSVRFCGACWKINIKKGNSLLKAYKRADPVILKLLPHEFFASSSIDPKYNNPWNSYFVPEFEAVADHYMRLPVEERAAYVEERQKFVLAMHEHAKAVGEWEYRVRRETMLEGDRAQKNRQESIEQKLIAMGYSKEDFPPAWSPEWSPLINQPRELTPRIWKKIEHKLVAAIKVHKERTLQKQLEARLKERRQELWLLYEDYAVDLPDEIGPIPSYDELTNIGSVKALVEEDESRIPFSQERFDMVVPEAVEKFSTEARAELVVLLQTQQKCVALKAYVDSLADKPVEGEKSGTSQDVTNTQQLDTNSSYGETSLVHNQALPLLTNDQSDMLNALLRPLQYSDPLSVTEKLRLSVCNDSKARAIYEKPLPDANPDDLLLATSIFRCRDCPYYDRSSCMGFLELKEHSTAHVKRQKQAYSTSIEHSTKAKEVLQAFGLPDDTKFSDISGKILCMCAKPGFEQPATFSRLVTHLLDEDKDYRKILSKRTSDAPIDDVYYNNHDLSGGADAVLKLGTDKDELPAFAPIDDNMVMHFGKCKICERLVGYDWYAGEKYYHKIEDFVHHVRTRHRREPTTDDIGL